jgi:hypothetical protein
LLIFPNDDRLVFENCQPTETSLDVEVDDGAIAISVPWEAIAYWMQSPRPSSASLISGIPARSDRLLLSNGDLISGELTAFTPEGLRIATASGVIAIAVERIAAVSLNPDLTSLPSLPESWIVLLLADGSRLTATHGELSDASFNVRLLFGSEVSIPVSQILSVNYYSKSVTSLTTLSAHDWQHESYIPDSIDESDNSGTALLPRIPLPGSLLQRANPGWNRSTQGGPLLLGNAEYPRGIGMRPRSALTFNIDGEFIQFRAIVGIDDRVEGQGSVEFRIESATDILWSSPVVTGATPPLDTGLIDIAGRKELTLIVDFAEWGDVQDIAVWGNPILIRPQSTE